MANSIKIIEDPPGYEGFIAEQIIGDKMRIVYGKTLEEVEEKLKEKLVNG